MIGAILVGLIAALHVYILVLEMFLWTKPAGMKAFNLTPEFAQATKALAANQGLYNGFLGAGLIWALLVGVPGAGQGIAVFFLACVLVAGVFGAVTAARKILFIQAVPAVLALLAVGFGL
jgi:putative membrane protein